MSDDDRKIIRALYREACHGAGADVRWRARDRLDAIMEEAGLDMWRVFEAEGLDAGAYWASRPISRAGG